MAADHPAARLIGRIAGLVVVAGLAVTFGAVAWWAAFYGAEGQGDLGGALRCVWSNRGTCGVASGMTRAAGKLAYSPTLFWFGVSLLLAGIAARLALSRRE